MNAGLIVVHSWTEYAVVALLITQLSDIMHLPKAASVVNLLDGNTAAVMLLNAYFSETYLGPFLDIFCTTLAYISGVLLFYLGAGNLKNVEIQLIYAAVILIGLGRAGRDIQLNEFLSVQCRTEEEDETEERVESRRKIWWRSAYILGIIGSAYLFTKASWMTLCKISIIAMATAFVLFLLGFTFYEHKKPAKATLHNMLQVLYVAITRNIDTHLRVNISTLRVFNKWLDATAIENQTAQGHPLHYEMDIWKRISEKELKSFLTLLPLWSTFLIYGLLLPTANTFFYEQTGYTANYLGRISAFSDEQSDYSCNDLIPQSSIKVPAIIFVIIRFCTSFLVLRLYDFLLRLRWGLNVPRVVLLVTCGVGLAVSPICCFLAWKIEEYRVDQRMNHAICISFLWLFPQFMLMGLMEGLVYGGMESIFISVVPHTLCRYGPTFTQFALNIGHFFSLPFIYIFLNLFDDDLDLSRLGVYYRNIGYVCLVNLAIYLCVAMYYLKQESSGADEVMEQALDQIHNLEELGLESAGDHPHG